MHYLGGMPSDKPIQSPVGFGEIFRFWLPLAATWLMMAVEGPTLAALIARMGDPKYNLAAYGVAFAFAIIVEAPVIMMMSASTTLVTSALACRRLRRFAMSLNVMISVAMIVILLPPVYDLIFRRLIGLEQEVLRLTHRSLLILIPWPAAIGYRRFYQGILIRGGQTRRVAYGTVTRMVTMLGTAFALYHLSSLPGAWLGATALSVGVCVEALASRFMVVGALKRLRELPASSGDDAPGYGEILRFYTPLALTATLALAVHPMVTFFMGQAPFSLESLAVLPVIGSLVFIFRAPGLSYQEVAITLLGRGPEQRRPVFLFAGMLSLGAAGGLSLIAFTPLAGFWFERVSGLSSELSTFARPALMALALMPGLSVMLSLQRAILVERRHTNPITWATLLEVGGVLAGLLLAIKGFHLAGALAASLALMLGRLFSNLYLLPVFRRPPVLIDKSVNPRL
jgi:progressive ankylosis protein